MMNPSSGAVVAPEGDHARQNRSASEPPVLLPNGEPFPFWEPSRVPTRTWHVACQHPDASDEADGSEQCPFRTIQRASEVVQPGQRVVIHGGVYREWVRPRRGGDGPDSMISFEAAPGEDVVVRGSEIIARESWRPARHMPLGPIARVLKKAPDPGTTLWYTRLPHGWFVGNNPFATVNRSQFANEVIRRVNLDNPLHLFTPEQIKRALLKRGLLFQNGRRLKQVSHTAFMDDHDGTYWVDSDGLTLIVRPFADADPRQVTFEATARRQILAPESDTFNLGYIRLAGITFEHAGDGWPLPPEGAVSTNGGHHWVIEDCIFRQCNAVGLEIGAHPEHPLYNEQQEHGFHIVRRNQASDCGCIGMAGQKMQAALIEDNHVHHCAWHEMEQNFENAGIKFHATLDCLVRRNLVHDMVEGCGIWLDARIVNSRVTGNLVHHCQTQYGGIFIEVSRNEANLVDHNIVLHIGFNPSCGEGGNGIYEHDCDRLQVRHNLVAHCSGAAIMLRRGEAWRMSGPGALRGSTGRKHIAEGNLLIACGQFIELHNADNTSDHNTFAGPAGSAPFRVRFFEDNLNLDTWREFYGFDLNSTELEAKLSFDPASRLLTLDLDRPPLQLQRHASAAADWSGAPRGDQTTAGPFESLAAGRQKWNADPRSHTSSRKICE